LQLKSKLAVAFAVLTLLIGVVFGVQYYYLGQEPSLSGPTRLDETFYASDFTYGPQAWVPYASKMPIAPDVDVNSGGYYVMFVDLNATSNLNATFPCVRVDYELSEVNGMVAFHVYGYIQSNGGLSWTNRVEGDGASGYYVTNEPQGSSGFNNAQRMDDFNHICVKVANKAGAAFDDFGNDTYLLKFEKEGGGLNSMHITMDPSIPTGQVTTTRNMTGTFYVNFTGDRVQENFILLVAVNGAVGEDFAVRLRASVQ
jgi:hypothetical protein